jgi:hypothetical protein
MEGILSFKRLVVSLTTATYFLIIFNLRVNLAHLGQTFLVERTQGGTSFVLEPYLT